MSKKEVKNLSIENNSPLKVKCKFECPSEDHKEIARLRKEFIIQLEKYEFKVVPGLGYGPIIYGLISKDKLPKIEKIENLTTSKWD